MSFKYDLEFDKEAIIKNIDRLINQIFKLLPSREEGEDWVVPLQNLILEITGLKVLWIDQVKLIPLLCKLEMLQSLTEENDFLIFRKLIFESLSLLKQIEEELQNE